MTITTVPWMFKLAGTPNTTLIPVSATTPGTATISTSLTHSLSTYTLVENHQFKNQSLAVIPMTIKMHVRNAKSDAVNHDPP